MDPLWNSYGTTPEPHRSNPGAPGLPLAFLALTLHFDRRAAAHHPANHVQQRSQQANAGHADQWDQQRARQQRAQTGAHEIRRVEAGRPGGGAVRTPAGWRQGKLHPDQLRISLAVPEMPPETSNTWRA